MKKNQIVTGILAGIMLLNVNILFAQSESSEPDEDDIYHFYPVVVSADRVEVPLMRVSSSVTVIGKNEIENAQLHNTGDVLRNVPGATISRSGSTGKATSLFLRGGNSGHTLVLIDGVPVNNPMTGSFDFSILPASNIEKIEIVKGPQSTLYGSDAIGGIVNIISKKGRGSMKVNAGFDSGTFNTLRGTASVSGRSNTIGYALDFTDFSSDGIMDNDDYSNRSYSGRIDFTIPSVSDVSISGRQTQADGGVPGWRTNLGYNQTSRFINDQSLYSVKLRQQFNSNWNSKIILSSITDENQFLDPMYSYWDSKIETAVLAFDWQNDIRLSDYYMLTVGVEQKNMEGKFIPMPWIDDLLIDEKIDNKSVYLQNSFLYKDFLTLSLGGRMDKHSTFGSDNNIRLATAYIFNPGADHQTKFHASYGTGFKAPGFNDLYYPMWGNLDLLPEESKSYEFGIVKYAGKSGNNFGITFFNNEFENLIGYDPIISMAGNRGQAKTGGFELIGSAQVSDHFQISGEYTVTETEDISTGNPLLRRPKHSGSVNININPTTKLNANIRFLMSGERYDFDFLDGIPGFYPGFSTLDAALTFKATSLITVRAKAENLLDAEYEEVVGYPSPGRAFTIGVNINL